MRKSVLLRKRLLGRRWKPKRLSKPQDLPRLTSVENTDRTNEYKQVVKDFEIMEEQRKLIQMQEDLERAKLEKKMKDAKDIKLQLRKKL